MKVNSFKINESKIYIIKEETELFKDIYKDLINIIKKINPSIEIIEIAKEKINEILNGKVLTILPNESAVDDKYYQIFIDRGDMTGRFNFYKEFLETNDLNFEAKSFFKVIRKIRYNWKNSSKKKSFFRDIYSKLLNFKNSYGIKNFTKLIKFIKSEFLIKYNFEALNYAFCYKKPKKFEEDFKFVYQNLSDKQSKDYYYEFYYGNFQKNFDKFLFNHLNCIQYSDYINLDKDSVILNCGVRAGFEIPIYLSKNVKQIYNIDPSGAKHLDPYVRKHMEIKTKTEMKFIHEALYSADSVYGISKSNLNITSLEKIIKKFNINNIDLIKSDIEGGERVMADELIYICNKFRPQLAISIYHNNYDKKKFILNDGVEIPKKLIKNLKNYNFYFKHYSFDKNEAIFYTIPN